MSILDALKNLVVKCGGTPKGSNIAEVIDDLAETSSGGGGNVVIVDLSEIPVEHAVDATTNPSSGDGVTFEDLYIFDVDPNKYYIFKTVDEMDGVPGVYIDAYYSQSTVATIPFVACEDTTEEHWIECKTFSDTVDVIVITALNGGDVDNLTFVPTSTQFKTYKKYVSNAET